MFCGTCGKKIPDDSHFCPFCGTPIPVMPGATENVANAATAATTSSAPTPAAGSPAPAPAANASNSTQVSGPAASPTQSAGPQMQQAFPNDTQAQPMLASAQPSAFQQNAAPAQGQPQPAPAADGMGQQVAEARKRSRRKIPMALFIVLVVLALAATAFAASYIYRTFIAPRIEPTEQEETPEPEEEARPEDVYDDILQLWTDTQASGWPTVDESTDADLSEVSEVAAGRASYLGNAHGSLVGATLEYAYQDLDSDGTPELVIGYLFDESSDAVYVQALYTSNGSDVTSVTDGQGWNTSAWTLYKNGYAALSGGGTSGGMTVYQLQNGDVTMIGEVTNEEILTGTGDAPDLGEYYLYSDFEWHTLADFSSDSGSSSESGAESKKTTSATHAYENDYFYVDLSSDCELTLSVTDGDDGSSWYLLFETPAGVDGGGSDCVHVGGTPGTYATTLGTTPDGKTVWLENVAGGNYSYFDGEKMNDGVTITVK